MSATNKVKKKHNWMAGFVLSKAMTTSERYDFERRQQIKRRLGK